MRIRDMTLVVFVVCSVASCTAVPGPTPLSPSNETTLTSGSSTQWVILPSHAQADDVFARCLQGTQDARCFTGAVFHPNALTFLNSATAVPTSNTRLGRVQADAGAPAVTNLTWNFDPARSRLVLDWFLSPRDYPTGQLLGYVLEAGSSSGQSDVGSLALPVFADVASGGPYINFITAKYEWYTSVTAFGTFYVRLHPVTPAGVGPASNEIAVTIVNPALPGRTDFPGASTQGATVVLHWNAPATGAPPTTYIVQASSTAGGLPNLANFATGNTATTFTASGVPAGTYYIHILAANNAGAGPPSDEFQVTVSTNCTAAPNSPSNFGWTRELGIAFLYWRPPVGGGDVSSYLIEAGSGPGLADSAVIDTGSVVTNLLAGIRNGSLYYVRVRAKNACGVSGPSNEVIVSRPL